MHPLDFSLKYDKGDIEEDTDDEYNIGVRGLHPGRRARIFVPSKILSIYYGDDRVQTEVPLSLTLELADLKGECGGEGRAAALDDDTVWSIFLFHAVVSTTQRNAQSS